MYEMMKLIPTSTGTLILAHRDRALWQYAKWEYGAASASWLLASLSAANRRNSIRWLGLVRRLFRSLVGSHAGRVRVADSLTVEPFRPDS
jgi:hypothetical protein